MAGFCIVSAAMANSGYKKLNHFADEVVSKMPASWRVVERSTGAIPYGHYDGLKYEGPRGLYLVLVGKRDVTYDWKDKKGTWHEEPILKEAVELWIMPLEYHQSWKRYFVMKKTVPAEQVFSGRTVDAYGDESVYWPPSVQNRYEQVLPHASEFRKTPNETVQSWVNWKDDVKAALQAAEE